jgi:hypothetical protein
MECGAKGFTPNPRYVSLTVAKRLTNILCSKPGDVVTISIPSGEKYYVHSPILIQVSEYFRRGLNGQMIEARTRTFNLTEHATADAVSLFVRWVYARSNGRHMDWAPGRIPTTGTLIDAWLLGDYLQAPDFVFLIEEILHRYANTTPFDIDGLGSRWEKISFFHDFRDDLVQCACRQLKEYSWESRRRVISHLPRMLLEDICLCLVSRVTTEPLLFGGGNDSS